jgi:hypothetical protein
LRCIEEGLEVKSQGAMAGDASLPNWRAGEDWVKTISDSPRITCQGRRVKHCFYWL